MKSLRDVDVREIPNVADHIMTTLEKIYNGERGPQFYSKAYDMIMDVLSEYDGTKLDHIDRSYQILTMIRFKYED